jgi:rhamnulokinase
MSGREAEGELAVAAVDLGASSGRVMVGRVGRDGRARLELREVHRFPNGGVPVGGTLHWDVLRLYSGILDGLQAAAREADIVGIGIDAWAVDYGLFDSDGALLGNPVHYRDDRTEGVPEKVAAIVSPEDQYALTGVAQLPLNTIYQLFGSLGTAELEAARTLLLIPDLFGYWLTGAIGAERTNVSTTGLYDVYSRTWSADLAERLGIPGAILPPLRDPGSVVGQLEPAVAAAVGLPSGTPVIAVGSHDTASAVVGVPAEGERFAYVSCGTWSLVGVELDRPVLTEAAREAGFTNEVGVDDRTRFLRNVMGLWLLQECQRTWTAAGLPADLATLLADAGRVPAFTCLIDPDEPQFFTPGDMPARIAEACVRLGQTPPQSQAETVRCIVDSLALAYRRYVRQVQELSGRDVDVVHVVGGGARNALLCQLAADGCGLPVAAGPVESAALGNVLVQARTLGASVPDLAAMRTLLRETQEVRRYEPRGTTAPWDAAEARVFGA